jgi:hypothetical protein
MPADGVVSAAEAIISPNCPRVRSVRARPNILLVSRSRLPVRRGMARVSFHRHEFLQTRIRSNLGDVEISFRIQSHAFNLIELPGLMALVTE